MTKRLWISLSLFSVLVLAVGVLATGCSSSGKTIKFKNTKQSVKKPSSTLKLVTTSVAEDTGIFDVLLPAFEKAYDIKVKIEGLGTAEAIDKAKNGEADVLLLHASETEEELMSQGYGSLRKDVMYTDYVILGPPDDPAGIIGEKDVLAVFKKIAAKKAFFVTRGDNTGSNRKELAIWEKAGIKPDGDWYLKAGKGTGAALRLANEKKGYVMVDRATWLENDKPLKVKLLFERDKELNSPYVVIAVNPEKFPKINFRAAADIVNYITSEEGQKIIADFGKDTYKQPIFFTGAGK